MLRNRLTDRLEHDQVLVVGLLSYLIRDCVLNHCRLLRLLGHILEYLLVCALLVPDRGSFEENLIRLFHLDSSIHRLEHTLFLLVLHLLLLQEAKIMGDTQILDEIDKSLIDVHLRACLFQFWVGDSRQGGLIVCAQQVRAHTPSNLAATHDSLLPNRPGAIDTGDRCLLSRGYPVRDFRRLELRGRFVSMLGEAIGLA